METIKRWRVGDCDRLEKERDTLRAQLDAANKRVALSGLFPLAGVSLNLADQIVQVITRFALRHMPDTSGVDGVDYFKCAVEILHLVQDYAATEGKSGE